MLECRIYVHHPLDELSDVEIARYEFDPGLQIGDKVRVVDLVWGKIPDDTSEIYEESFFSFEAIVTNRQYQIEPQSYKEDIFRVLIELELMDKKLLSQLAEIIKNNTCLE
jgi:hypothetical protein